MPHLELEFWLTDGRAPVSLNSFLGRSAPFLQPFKLADVAALSALPNFCPRMTSSILPFQSQSLVHCTLAMFASLTSFKTERQRALITFRLWLLVALPPPSRIQATTCYRRSTLRTLSDSMRDSQGKVKFGFTPPCSRLYGQPVRHWPDSASVRVGTFCTDHPEPLNVTISPAQFFCN